MLQDYLREIANTTSQDDACEESYYSYLSALIVSFGESIGRKKTQITTLPKKTEFASSSILTATTVPSRGKSTGCIRPLKKNNNLTV